LGALATTTATATAKKSPESGRFVQQNNNFARASRFFYIFLCHHCAHDFDVKMPTDCTFFEGRKEATTNSFLSIFELECGSQEINS